MKLSTLARRFMPGIGISILCAARFGAKVSPRAEVEVTALLFLGKGCQISSFCKLKASDGKLRIGAHTQIATGCFISAEAAGIDIGAQCLIGPNCTLLSGNYQYSKLDVPVRLQGHVSKGLRIGNNVLIGANSVVLDGTEIGDNVIVSPGSVVSGRVPPNVVLSGNPAKAIFTRR